MAWSGADITIVLDEDLTNDPVVTGAVSTPQGQVLVMASVTHQDRTLVLDGLHIEAGTTGPNAWGVARLRQLAQAVMERLDYDEIVVQGARRTTGGNPGRQPRELRFARKTHPAPQAGL